MCVGINEIVHAEFIREEWVRAIEPVGVATIKEKGRVAAEEEAATNGLTSDRGEEGEVSGAGGVDQGDVGDGHVETDGVRGDSCRIIVEQRGVGEFSRIGQGDL